jgi:DNA ligase-1
MTKLYKKDSKGKIRVWIGHTNGAELIEEYGLIDGKLANSSKTCKAKNVGKANETTPEEQALAELESRIKNKLDKGYFRTEEEARTVKVIAPMLAKNYHKEKKKIDWKTAYVQPKLDGMRCLAIIKNGNVTLKSRDGKVISTVRHINQSIAELVQILPQYDNSILDGELYAHGHTFQQNMSYIKKYSEGLTELVSYNVYDIVMDVDFTTRNIALLRLFNAKPRYIQEVLTYKVTTEEQLKSYHKNFLGDGYEGTILRWGDAPYKMKGRSSNLLKYKDFIDNVFEVVDVIPSDARPEQGVLVCINESGQTFKANPKMSHAERANLLTNKKEFIGQTAEVRYFEETDGGVPRFPVCVGFRLDKQKQNSTWKDN